MSELKAGYWRSKGGERYELFCERDGLWFGRIVGREVAVMRDMDDARRAGWEYIGPTLPPDPGPGWRLLKKWPEPEELDTGDQEFRDDIGWLAWPSVVHVDYKQCENAWYRRRVTPEQPQPPEEFDVGEGYRRLEVGETRLRTDEYLPNSGDGSDREWLSCNSLEVGWLSEPVKSWMVPHRRRIDPQPFEGELRNFPCERPRKDGPHYLRDSDGLWYVQRQYHAGEWRDVGVQQ